MNNERTSKRVAKIAAKVLSDDLASIPGFAGIYARVDFGDLRIEFHPCSLSLAELKALAASCLTQTADKCKPRKAGSDAR